MRALVLAGIVVAGVPSRDAGACEYHLDRTHVLGAARTLPAHPSLFVHVGRDSSPRVPTFTRLDGTPIRYTATLANTPGLKLWRVDLDISTGAILIGAIDEAEPTIVLVDPKLEPRTRAVDLVQTGSDGTPWRYPWVEVDSDAELFRVEWSDGSMNTEWVPPNEGRGDFSTSGQGVRVIALYPDGAEELILDYRAPDEAAPTWPIAVLSLLGVVGFVARRRWYVETIER